MAMEMDTTRSAGSSDGHGDRWQRIWSHREHLLKVARRRSLCREDAEDAVHEAMVRAWERPGLDDERLGAWLTTVTVRLCVDRHRQVSREADVQSLSSTSAPGQTTVEEAVCDRFEAAWLARRSHELPPRQAQALWLKAADMDVGQVAERMGLSYRTVESLLARGRRTLRRLLVGALALLVWRGAPGRPRTGGGAAAGGVASTAVTLAVLGFALPPGDVPGGADPVKPPLPRAGEGPPAHPMEHVTVRTPALPGAETRTDARTGGAESHGSVAGARAALAEAMTGLAGGVGLPSLAVSVGTLDDVRPAAPTLPVPGGAGLPERPDAPVRLPDGPGPGTSPPRAGVPEGAAPRTSSAPAPGSTGTGDAGVGPAGSPETVPEPSHERTVPRHVQRSVQPPTGAPADPTGPPPAEAPRTTADPTRGTLP